MKNLFAPFFRVGIIIWTLICFALTFTTVYQVMLANGKNPLNTSSGLPIITAFFAISMIIALLTTLVGCLVFQWMFNLIEA